MSAAERVSARICLSDQSLLSCRFFLSLPLTHCEQQCGCHLDSKQNTKAHLLIHELQIDIISS